MRPLLNNFFGEGEPLPYSCLTFSLLISAHMGTKKKCEVDHTILTLRICLGNVTRNLNHAINLVSWKNKLGPFNIKLAISCFAYLVKTGLNSRMRRLCVQLGMNGQKMWKDFFPIKETLRMKKWVSGENTYILKHAIYCN